MDKNGLLTALVESARLMKLAGENQFKVRAYETGARALEALEGTPQEWIEQGTHLQTKGIGKGLAAAIEEWAATGKLKALEELRVRVPEGVAQMLEVPGLGAKKVQAVFEKIGIDSVEKLEAAARNGTLNELAGFGAKTAERILAGIEQRQHYAARFRADQGRKQAERVKTLLEQSGPQGELFGAGQRVEIAGSARRGLETVKDIDLIATSDNPQLLLDAFTGDTHVQKIVAQGPTKCSVVYSRTGLPADLRVVKPHEFAAAWLYFTGSKEHNTQLRGRARRMGLKLNEYGLFRVGKPPGKGAKPLEAADVEADHSASGELIATESEADIYRALGLAYIEPEMREGLGEIEAAENGTLPKLIELGAMRGMIHCHTTHSDGKQSVEEAARAAQRRGYTHMVFCDHSMSAHYAGGLTIPELEEQWREIDAVNKTLQDFTIFKGIESDIRADGSLDYPNAILKKFDLVVASVHSRMDMPLEEMTARVCRALEHPATRILGHPTGRLLLRREPFKIDLKKVFETAVRHNVLIEINCNPNRLDVDWRYIREAKAAGCKFAVDPDAHSEADMDYTKYGIGIARKGWLEASDIVNTLPLGRFKTWLKSKQA